MKRSPNKAPWGTTYDETIIDPEIPISWENPHAHFQWQDIQDRNLLARRRFGPASTQESIRNSILGATWHHRYPFLDVKVWVKPGRPGHFHVSAKITPQDAKYYCAKGLNMQKTLEEFVKHIIPVGLSCTVQVYLWRQQLP